MKSGDVVRAAGILLVTLLSLAASWSIAACHKASPPAETATPSVEQKRAVRAAQVPAAIQRHWTYLNRVRQTDEFSSKIARTLLNERNQLGIVFSSDITDDQIPDLTRKVMEGMAKEFPKEDVSVVAYGASSPPHPVGAGHVASAT
ncbi:hypothetical protein BH20VER3_BH20VER3_22680 [soil metagenome]